MSIELVKLKGRLGEQTLTNTELWCNQIKPLLNPTLSTYAKGRQELWIKKKCDLKKNFTLTSSYEDEFISSLANAVLPNFDIALVLFYPAGTNINPHRDHTVFASTAICINLQDTIFNITDDPNKHFVRYNVNKGDVIQFNCKHLHATETNTKDRWSIILWYLKSQYK